MFRTSLAAVAVAGLVGVTLATTAGSAGAANKETLGSGRTITASLTGAAEVPGPGDPDATGQATVTINRGQGKVCVALAWQDTGPLVGAHIHEAPAGEAGPIVIPLSPVGQGSNQQCVEVDRDLASDLIRTPEDYYVNLHTAAFPMGAIRGQLSK